jgi:hypothetical protein
MCIERSLRCLEQPMRERISLEARVWAASARTSFSSSIPFSRSTRSSGRRGVRARRLFRHHRSGTTDSDCRVLHLPSAPTSGALRFEAECQPIGVFPARQTHGLLGSEPHRSALPALAAEGQPSTGSGPCQLQIGRDPRSSADRTPIAPAVRPPRAARSASSPAARAGSGRGAGRQA